MKKAYILIIYVFLTYTCAFSMHDSVQFYVPEDLFGYYIPLNLDNSVSHSIVIGNGGGHSHVSGMGMRYYSSEGIRIKGIATIAAHWYSRRNGTVLTDTVIDYDLTASIVKYVDENNVDYFGHTLYNVLHPTATDTMIIAYDSINSDTVILHEVFFDESVTVSDTFYCMIDALDDKYDSTFLDSIRYMLGGLSLQVTRYSDTMLLTEIPRLAYLLHYYIVNQSQEWRVWRAYDDEARSRQIPLTFPILDLGDSAGVAEVDAVGRNTAVWPNPARGTVSVASGYGLKRVTVHDIGGRLVLSREASGLSTSTDVSPLPRGAYFVTVETLVGTTTKKLLVE